MSLTVSLAQIKTDPANVQKNTQKIIDAIHQAKDDNADLVVFPELAISGYGASNYLLNSGFLTNVQSALTKIIKESDDITVIVGYPESVKGEIFSSVAIIQNRKLLGSHRKMLLPTSELFSENYYLSRGNSPTTLNIDGTKIGIAISEDILDYQALPKCDLLIISAAFNWANAKADEKESIIQEMVATMQTPTIFVNALTATDNLIFSGNSSLFNKNGQAIVRLQRFKENQVTFDLSFIDKIHRFPKSPIRGQEALYAALQFSLTEYLLKVEKEKVIISITPEIDSQLLLSLAVDSIGAHNVTALLFNDQEILPSKLKQIETLCLHLKVELKKKTIDHNDIINLGRSFNIDEKAYYDWEQILSKKIRSALFIAYASMINALPLGDLNKTQLTLGAKCAENSSLSYYMPFFDLYHTDIIALAEFRNIISPLFDRHSIMSEKERSIRHPLVHVNELKLSIVDDIIYRYIERHESLEYIIKQYDDVEMVTSLIILIRKTKQQRSRTIAGPLVASRSISHDWHFPHLTTVNKEENFHSVNN